MRYLLQLKEKQFQLDVQQALGDRLKSITKAEQMEVDDGRFLYRVTAVGESNGVSASRPTRRLICDLVETTCWRSVTSCSSSLLYSSVAASTSPCDAFPVDTRELATSISDSSSS